MFRVERIDAVMKRVLVCLLLVGLLWPMTLMASEQQKPNAFEEEFWITVMQVGTSEALVEYLWLFPDGRHVDAANAEIKRLKQYPGAVAPAKNQHNQPEAGALDRNKAEPAPQPVQKPKAAEPSTMPAPSDDRKLSVLPTPPPVEVMPTCAERFAALGPDAGQALCVTFIESGNFMFSRDCRPHSFGFAGISVPEDAFFSAGDTLLLRATDTDSIQTWSDRPYCYELADGKPAKLRHFQHLMVEARDTTAQVCDAMGKCF